jgi:hypothetical protein
MVVDAELGTGERLQNYAEPARRDVEATGLKPYAIGIGDPQPLIIQVGVDDKVIAVSLLRIESVGYAVEGSDWHVSPLF